jgi:hypothetical protein
MIEPVASLCRWLSPGGLGEARLAVFDFVEGWYNPRRRHSALDDLSPMIFERSKERDDRTVTSGATIDQGVLPYYPPRGAGQ